MAAAIRFTLVAFSLIFVAVGGYYRIQSQRSGERLDRTKEGWPILIGLRLAGLLTIVCVAVRFENPASLCWSSWPVPEGLRWLGAGGFGCAVAWLIWMFRTLGPNLTDTMVTRRDSYFVDHGPYRSVRNPMYTGVLMIGISLGVALGTWLVPLMAGLMFVVFAMRTRIEEHYLIERFGDQYRDYMKRVGRFSPKV